MHEQGSLLQQSLQVGVKVLMVHKCTALRVKGKACAVCIFRAVPLLLQWVNMPATRVRVQLANGSHSW